MGVTSIVFIIVLLLVSGFVAWVGDVVGRQMGKRRIALFRLRPRRTSVLIAVITGMLITGLTILTLALTSSTVRDALVLMDENTRDLDRLISERNQAWSAVDSMKATIDEGEKAIQLQRIQIDDLTGQLTTAETELGNVQEELAGLRQQAASYQAEVNSLKTERDNLNREYQDMVAQKEAEAADLEAQIAQLNTQISDREKRVADLNARIEALNTEVQAWAGGEVKVREGQQLAAFKIDTTLDDISLDTQLGTQLAAIRFNYRDPNSGEAVLTPNEMVILPEVFDQAIKAIRAIPASQAVVIAYASANVLENEPVTLRVEVTGYYKVYTQGTVLFSHTYNLPLEGTAPYRATIASFMEQAKNFLVDERNVIPTGTGELIQLTIDDLASLADRLRQVEFPATVSMVALKDIYRTDFLVYGEQFTVNITHGETTEPE